MKKLIYVVLLFTAIGCGKDETIITEKILGNETISGTVSYEDGQPCCVGMTVSVIKSTVANPTPEVISTVDVSSDGTYIFEDVLPEQDDLYIRLNQGLSLISAQDDTPDGDELEGGFPGVIWIGVYLDKDEDDDGNNFVLRVQECEQSLVLGHVYSVIGEDTTDLSEEVVVNLYVSDMDGNLIELLDERNTIGSFSFTVDNETMATLELDYSGLTTLPVALSLIDESPDSDPLAGIEITHLPVHLDSCEVDSDNNIYLFFNENVGCAAMPEILPYPALCDTSIVCTYDKLPVFVIDELGNPITTTGGIYGLEWTDLVTGQSQQGDWTYQYTNHPIKLDISYPDGCVYTLYYHRDCEQDLIGEFSMRTMTTGLGPTYTYDVGEVNWTFDPFGGALEIEYNITNSSMNPFLLPEGNYTYEINESMGMLNLSLENTSDGMTFNVGRIGFGSGQVILDDDIAVDGIGRFFEKN